MRPLVYVCLILSAVSAVRHAPAPQQCGTSGTRTKLAFAASLGAPVRSLFYPPTSPTQTFPRAMGRGGNARRCARCSSRRGTLQLTASSGSNDPEFEKWYAKTKRTAFVAPHTPGDVGGSGNRRWRIVGEGRQENPASDAKSSASPVWIYDGVEEGGNGEPVQVLSLSLTQMGGSWKGLDSFRAQAKTWISLSHEVQAVPRALASFEADNADGDRVNYLITQLPASSSLLQLLNDDLRPTEEQVIHVGLRLLRGLEGLWKVRPPVSHGAIAPGNIMVDWPPGPHGEGVWLTGLGTRDRVREALLAEGYLPPLSSVMASGSLEEDMYGVGAVMLRMVSGRPPSDFAFGAISGGGGAKMLRFRDSVWLSSELGEVLQRLLTIGGQSGYRFATPTDARTALLQLLADVTAPLLPAPPSSFPSPLQAEQSSLGYQAAMSYGRTPSLQPLRPQVLQRPAYTKVLSLLALLVQKYKY